MIYNECWVNYINSLYSLHHISILFIIFQFYQFSLQFFSVISIWSIQLSLRWKKLWHVKGINKKLIYLLYQLPIVSRIPMAANSSNGVWLFSTTRTVTIFIFILGVNHKLDASLLTQKNRSKTLQHKKAVEQAKGTWKLPMLSTSLFLLICTISYFMCTTH